MFKGMESQSVHVIEIIKNGYNPTEHPEPTVSSSGTKQVELSVLIALGNLVLRCVHVNANAHNGR